MGNGKGYSVPPGTPGIMQREFVFPGVKDPGGYAGNGYRKRKKVTARGHTGQSQKRADRLRGREFMKKFRGKTRPILV
jgi:hypothetical protein